MKKRRLVLLTVVAQMMVMLAMSLTPAVARPLHKNATKVIFTPVRGREVLMSSHSPGPVPTAPSAARLMA
jgi:hypothetical protein